MEDSETPRMHKYGANKTTRIMMATARHVTSSSGLRKFQSDGFLLDGVYKTKIIVQYILTFIFSDKKREDRVLRRLVSGITGVRYASSSLLH